MALSTMAEITNLYLYKQRTLPLEEERIASQFITLLDNKIEVNKNEFMDKETGPGRFITADDFLFVRKFFETEEYYSRFNDKLNFVNKQHLN